MQASIFPITQENLAVIHPQARKSVFWELAPEVVRKVDPVFEKEAWLFTTLLEYGTCGFNIGYANGTPALSSVIYCSGVDAPGAVRLPTAPISTDAAVISSLFIDEVFRGVGMESVLLDAAILDLIEKDIPAVEAFGLRHDYVNSRELSSDVAEIVNARNSIGLMSVDNLESAGFEVVAQHPILPRLRLELPPADGLLSAHDTELLLAAVETM